MLNSFKRCCTQHSCLYIFCQSIVYLLISVNFFKSQFKNYFNQFIWLPWVLVAACELLGVTCGIQFPHRGLTQALCTGNLESQPLDHQESPQCEVFIPILLNLVTLRFCSQSQCVGFPPHHYPVILRHQLGVLQLNQTPTLCTWRQHQIPWLRAQSHSHFRHQLQIQFVT